MKGKRIIIIFIVLFILLIIFAVQLPCVVHYNRGNDLYNEGNYGDAIKEYQEALKLFPFKYKECNIRINMALAMINTINDHFTVGEKLGLLTNARSVLIEDGCANDNDDHGHSEEAEKLKKDIEREIEKLKKEEESNKDNEDEEDKKDEEIKDESSNIDEENKKKLNELREIQEKGLEERQTYLDFIDSAEGYRYYGGKNW